MGNRVDRGVEALPNFLDFTGENNGHTSVNRGHDLIWFTADDSSGLYKSGVADNAMEVARNLVDALDLEAVTA